MKGVDAPSPKMQQAKNAPSPCANKIRHVSGLEIGLTAVCVTLSLSFLVLNGSLARSQELVKDSTQSAELAFWME
ncbi:hypothetical protein [Pseudanabaena sp. FACHB-2040]|uniref:hypothetical protein n=1 Tax=Pseudanabaena sp. FACHB-2040 TaxID=2692859 RepID=UPI001681E58A|nr:hypothetical protein [Pseudanabaena sp. FACHB-2040]MBD2256856.1 hypothetical protein [Pseudanabaena sp. FACHB-2040]